jgi:hypothetical protein
MAKRVSSGSRFYDVILGNPDAVTDSRNLILARRVALWRPRVCGRNAKMNNVHLATCG